MTPNSLLPRSMPRLLLQRKNQRHWKQVFKENGLIEGCIWAFGNLHLLEKIPIGIKGKPILPIGKGIYSVNYRSNRVIFKTETSDFLFVVVSSWSILLSSLVWLQCNENTKYLVSSLTSLDLVALQQTYYNKYSYLVKCNPAKLKSM